MPKFQQSLFIARSQESANLFLNENSGAITALTLSSLLSKINDSNGSVLNLFMGKLLLKKVLENLELKHFDYLVDAEESLKEFFTYLVSCKKNELEFQEFGYSDDKLAEIILISKGYEDEKNRLGLVDSGDILRTSISMLAESSFFLSFQNIVLDSFEDDGIKFTSSKLEENALSIIRNFENVSEYTHVNNELKAPKTLTKVDTYFDEAIFAIKASRKLMEEGTKDTDIALVTSNLAQYRRVLESYADEYAMSFRFSSGTSVVQSLLYQEYLVSSSFEKFQETFRLRIQSDLESRVIGEEDLSILQREFVQVRKLHNEGKLIVSDALELLGLNLNIKEVVQSLAEDTYVPPSREQDGVLVTELNQITLQNFEHIIFIGTDLSQFPPKSKGNFLASVKQKESLLFFNNTYSLSAYYYQQLCLHTQNLHLSQALNSGKRPLYLSPIIDNAPKTVFEDYSLIGQRETLFQLQRYALDPNSEAYIDSMLSEEITSFDGVADASSFEVGSLSASKLTSYAQCPLKYQFSHQYRCEALALDKDEEDLEASDIGTIFHSITEHFSNDVKSHKMELPESIDTSIKKKLEEIAHYEYDTYMKEHFTDKGLEISVFHKIVFNDLVKGLHSDHHQKGLLIRFLEYVYDEGNLEHFFESEKYFLFDENFELTKDKGRAILTGFIDRIDKNDLLNTVKIIDYKTGKYKKDKENRLLEQMQEFKQFQLPLYMLYAKRAFQECEIDSFLVSFKHGDTVKAYAHLSTDEENGLLFDATFEKGLISRVNAIRDDIHHGKFGMSPSELNCEYCEFERICHKSVLVQKEVNEQV